LVTTPTARPPTAPAPAPGGIAPAAVRYGLALVFWGAACGVTAWLAPELAKVTFMLFWPAVLASAWYGGRGPALLVIALSVLAVDYLFVETVGILLFPRTAVDAVALGSFALLAAGVSEITGRFRVAQQRLRAAEWEAVARAEDLEEQAVELETKTDELQTQAAELEANSEELMQSNDELARARQAAEEANQAKTDFLATMSHELRTPLNAIAGYAELLELGIHGPVTAEQRVAISRIQRSQRHLLGLINDVLNFAKLEAGHVEYHIADVPVRETVDEIEPLVTPQLQAKGLEFDRAACADGRVVRADGEKLQQILLNLLSNAIKFTPEGGTVTMLCEDRGHVVCIGVRDSGIGIAAERLQHLFSPFVQVERRLNAPREGTGLGLAISRDLARGMDGDLTVESQEGRGSTFTVILPNARAPRD
jgi:signal transduction histidine kinase